MKTLKYSIIIAALMIITGTVKAQEPDQFSTGRSFNYKGIEVFIKAEPTGAYDNLEEFKCPTGEAYNGAGGLRRIVGGIDKALGKKMKGKVGDFDAIIAHKPGKITLIKLKAKEASNIGQPCTVVTEKKTKRLVFVCSYPQAEFEVVENVKFVEGGLGETYRGGNKLDIMINGFLDKAARRERKAKIEPFDAIYIDPQHLESGFLGVTMNAQLIRFKR